MTLLELLVVFFLLLLLLPLLAYRKLWMILALASLILFPAEPLLTFLILFPALLAPRYGASYTTSFHLRQHRSPLVIRALHLPVLLPVSLLLAYLVVV